MAESKVPQEWQFLHSLTPKELDELLFGKCDGCMMPCIKEMI